MLNGFKNRISKVEDTEHQELISKLEKPSGGMFNSIMGSNKYRLSSYTVTP